MLPLLFLIIAVNQFVSVISLRVEDALEGTCRGIHYKPLAQVDPGFINSLTYIPAINRFNLYGIASGHPNFTELREFELYYDICLRRNATSDGRVSVFGFGGINIAGFNIRARRENPSILDAIIPSVGDDGQYDPTRGDRFQLFVTLTDNKTFAFLATCLVGADQRGWDVFSTTPELSEATKLLIQEHALAMGFKREEMVFLSRRNCDLENNPNPNSGVKSGKDITFHPIAVNKQRG